MGSHRPRSVSASDAAPSASNVGAPDSRVNVDVPQGEGVTEADRSLEGAPTHHHRLNR